MNGIPLTKEEILKMTSLRQTGHSINEIQRILLRGKGTISRYLKCVKVLPEYQDIIKAKQGASKSRSKKLWDEAHQKAKEALKRIINKKTKLLIAAMLYWGEGTKKDFSLSNTDPKLIKTFVECLKSLGVSNTDFRITIRTYEDLNKTRVINYWTRLIGIPRKQILNVNVLKGKKKGKLQYGMCRIRVTRGGTYLKLAQSVIDLVSNELAPKLPS